MSCHPEERSDEGSCRAELEPRVSRSLASLGMTVHALDDTARSRLFTVCLLLLAACASPEATRTRGGGPGADVGNRRKPVEIHAGANPYHDTPCVTERVECKGPLPVFGPTRPPD